MKIGEIIQRVQSMYSKGVQSDDSRLTPRHIYNKLLSTRSRLIYQKANKKQKLNQWNFQTLECVELIKAPLNECPCLPPVGCTISRTKYKLPKPITNLTNHLIQSVISTDGSQVYSEILIQDYIYKKGNKYTANKIDYFIQNGYLYLTHKRVPKAISITGLFENPLDVYAYPSLCPSGSEEEECFDIMEQEFPIDEDLIEPLIELSLQELVIMFTQMKEDSTNNSQDDNLTQPQTNE